MTQLISPPRMTTHATQHILENRQGLRVALIVNDMSEINIDASLVTGGEAALRRGEEKMVSMQVRMAVE